MRYQTHTLSCGLRVIHLHCASPVVYCGYAVDAGSRDESPDEEGLAHFCEHLTFKGTERRRSWHVLNCLERVGGDLNAFTNKEDTVFHAAILREHLPRAVDLLTDIVLHSTYPQAEIDREVSVIADEIESYNDTPSELIYDEFDSLLFGSHPLGHNILGTADRLRQMTTADARRFTSRYYRPSNMVFFSSGDIPFGRLITLLERATSDQEAGTPQVNDLSPADPLLPPPPTGITERTVGSHQAHVMLGCRAFSIHSPERITLYLLNNLLGGPGMNARLNIALRERRGLVYTVESSMASYSDTGAWSVYFGCDHHHVNQCLRLVRNQLAQLIHQPLTDSQTTAAKKQLKGQIGIACDARESFTLGFAKSFLHYGWERNVERLYEAIDAITPNDLQQVASQLFDESHTATLIFK